MANTAIAGHWDHGALRSHIVQTLPLRDFAQALQHIEQQRATGRLVLTMD